MFQKAFNNIKEYLLQAVPELGNIITHWEDPFTFSKNRAILLPDKNEEKSGDLTFSVILWASTVEKNADAIAQKQIAVMEKLFKAVYSRDIPDGIIGAVITSAEYFDPAPQSPNIGIMQVGIQLTLDSLDDCDY